MDDSTQGGKHILIIEDELDMRFFLTTLVRASGCVPITARNGTEGVEKARDTHPDLIILDVMMPEKGGAIVYRELRTDDTLCGIPVIMLSAVSRSAFYHYLRMLNPGSTMGIPLPDAYVEKPPDPAYLQDKIREVLA